MSEHLLVLPDRDDAEELAEELAGAGFLDVRVVREALAGEDDAEDHEWAVHVVVEDARDTPDLRERLRALAEGRDGWYDPTPLG